ncbi:MAG TPA: phosphoglycerate kinase, partial [Spirochaetota bacterium]|nr:phosphoglycerate kinase [Spirochaetota bacterium]
MNKKNIEDIDVARKKIIMRADFNVPVQNGNIKDNSRIMAALPSIKYLLQKKAAVILMSHLGRPKGEKKPEFSLKPVADELQKLLGQEVKFAPDCIGEEVKAAADSLQEGEVLLLENLRFHKEEKTKDDNLRKEFAGKLASLAEIYINDAFGTAHREHASTANIAAFLPSACGYLIEKEIKYLGQAVSRPQKPMTAILGGAKISDKIPIIKQLLSKADNIIIGGGMAYTFYKAQGMEVGKSLLDNELIDTCKEFLEKGRGKIILPVDVKVTKDFDFSNMSLTSELTTVSVNNIPADKEGLDIGEQTI